tara:strand:+ start:1461 stop:1616 length:156 start_codon:yes stop_codon:yes gene_type:complete
VIVKKDCIFAIRITTNGGFKLQGLKINKVLLKRLARKQKGCTFAAAKTVSD